MVRAFCHAVDAVNGWVGKYVSYLIVPMLVLVTMEVILRYVFDRPTIWAWDVNVQLLAALGVLGGGYALLHAAHVAVDVMVVRFSPRKRAIIDLVTALVFFASIGVLLWQGADGAWTSLQTRETYSTFFRPPIYPLKIIMVVGIVLLLLQGIAKFLRDMTIATAPKSGDKQ